MMEIQRLICMRVIDMTVGPSPGSISLACPVCAEAIWVSLSSQQMLASSRSFQLCCTHCADPSQHWPHGPDDVDKHQRFADLKAQGEDAYKRMYESHNDQEIKWLFELAYESLRSAARISTELSLHSEAKTCQQRAEHVRVVYRQQFMQPPDHFA